MDFGVLFDVCNDKILRKRLSSTLLSSWLFMATFMFILSILVSFHPFYIHSWLQYNISSLFGIHHWWYIVLLMVFVTLITFLNASLFKVVPIIHTKRTDILVDCFAPIYFLNITCHMITFTIVLFFSYSILDNMDKITMYKNKPMSLYNRLIVSSSVSAVLAVCLVISSIKNSHYVYKFSEVNTSVITRVKESLNQNLASVPSWKFPLFVHVVVALIVVPFVESFFNSYSSFFINKDEETIYSLLNMRLLYTHVCVIVCLRIFVIVLPILHNAYFTQTTDLEVSQRYVSKDQTNLCGALNQDNNLLLKYLACIDLKNIAKLDFNKRSQIFGLSKEGKQPIYWSQILHSVILNLHVFCQSIQSSTNETNDKKKENMNIPLLATSRLLKRSLNNDSISSENESNSKMKIDESSTHCHKAYNNTSTKSNVSKIEMLSINQTNLYDSFNKTLDRSFVTKQNFWSSKDLMKNAKNILTKYSQTLFNSKEFTLTKLSNSLTPVKPFFTTRLVCWLKSLKTSKYWLNERVEMKKRLLFQHSQMHIWMLRGLSLLVLCSFEEDEYGVVQRDLPNILTCFISIYENLNKPIQLSASSSKTGEAKLKSTLKCELKQAIYRITTTFEDTLQFLDLKTDYVAKLNHFKNFRE